MNYSPILIPLSISLIVLAISLLWSLPNNISSNKHEDFLQCFSSHQYSKNSNSIINSTSYSSILNFSIRNQRFSTPNTPKPLVIIKPSNVSHIQAAVICSKSHGLQIRIRSGGHDYEGLSYVAYDGVPYILLDLIDLHDVTVDVESSTAWVQSGASIGELYNKIGEKSLTLAFPAGGCPTVGVGGHLSGGGYGFLMRKYGLAADNVIDATLVDANGEYHKDRESMGEDLFWAIRGGGGGSFGVVVAWKIKLVYVPPIVTVCSIGKTLEDGAINLIHRWQYVANKLDDNLFLGIIWIGGKSTSTDEKEKINPIALFLSLFLGKADEVLEIFNTNFPELGLTKEDCIESSWIQYGYYLYGLLTRSTMLPPIDTGSNKIKSDYVKQPMTEFAIKGMWERLKSQDIEGVQIVFVPFGGKMSQISESSIPYPHRSQILYQIGYYIGWQEEGMDAEERHLNWTTEFYNYMADFVSKSPRAAYANYRDLDIGSNNRNGTTTYEEAMTWGLKYFGNNFNRLVEVKTKVDPFNFFRHEQSIPTLTPA